MLMHKLYGQFPYQQFPDEDHLRHVLLEALCLGRFRPSRTRLASCQVAGVLEPSMASGCTRPLAAGSTSPRGRWSTGSSTRRPTSPPASRRSPAQKRPGSAPEAPRGVVRAPAPRRARTRARARAFARARACAQGRERRLIQVALDGSHGRGPEVQIHRLIRVRVACSLADFGETQPELLPSGQVMDL